MPKKKQPKPAENPAKNICPVCGHNHIQIKLTHWVMRWHVEITPCSCGMEKGVAKTQYEYALVQVQDTGWRMPCGGFERVQRDDLRSYKKPSETECKCSICRDKQAVSGESFDYEVADEQMHLTVECVICNTPFEVGTDGALLRIDGKALNPLM